MVRIVLSSLYICTTLLDCFFNLRLLLHVHLYLYLFVDVLLFRSLLIFCALYVFFWSGRILLPAIGALWDRAYVKVGSCLVSGRWALRGCWSLEYDVHLGQFSDCCVCMCGTFRTCPVMESVLSFFHVHGFFLWDSSLSRCKYYVTDVVSLVFLCLSLMCLLRHNQYIALW
jgi:hypothetical protein